MILAALLMVTVSQAQAQSLFKRMVNSISVRVTASKNIITKDIRLTDFSKLTASGSINMVYHQEAAGNPRVIITCPDNVLDYIVVEQKGSKLSIKLKDRVNISWNGRHDDKDFVIHVYSKGIDEFQGSGSGDYTLAGILQATDFKASLSGSGDVKIENLKASGDVSFNLTGSGDFKVNAVACQTLKARVTGSGDMDVKGIGSKEVDASVTGSGDIVLKGRTEHGKYNVTGSGDIHAKELVAAGIETKKMGSGDIYTE